MKMAIGYRLRLEHTVYEVCPLIRYSSHYRLAEYIPYLVRSSLGLGLSLSHFTSSENPRASASPRHIPKVSSETPTYTLPALCQFELAQMHG